MTYEIRMTPEAKTDLRSIFEYIAVDLQVGSKCVRSV